MALLSRAARQQLPRCTKLPPSAPLLLPASASARIAQPPARRIAPTPPRRQALHTTPPRREPAARQTTPSESAEGNNTRGSDGRSSSGGGEGGGSSSGGSSKGRRSAFGNWRLPTFYECALVCLGMGAGEGLMRSLGVEGDGYLDRTPGYRWYRMKKIRSGAEKLPLVRELEADPAWESWEAYEGMLDHDEDDDDDDNNNKEARRHLLSSRVTSGAMAGPRGLAYQRVFRNAATGECVTVAWLGRGLCGWPGVVHGGALATLLDESLGRAAILRFPARTGVTANLSLTYRAPTKAAQYVVVRARPVIDQGGGQEGGGGGGTGKGTTTTSTTSDRKLWVKGSVERLDGTVCVDARALFVVPKGVKLAPLVEKW